MAYLALYRKYRPKNFRDIVGQQHIVCTLKNAILNDRISHAYIFCGPRGTGKTTTAKVMAKALNCIQLQDTEPCNRCKNCTVSDKASSMDIVEIDAASNRGIEDIRELREEVKYSPFDGNYRVYIIDEVHMLTIEAFNALLKTLEEPPAHVVFILATTEPQKVPLTILSRCQRFDFRRISIGDMLKKLKYVAKDMGINAEEDALKLIAASAEGGLRDALGILEKCSNFGEGNVTADNVYVALGMVDKNLLSSMTNYLLTGNAEEALRLIDMLFKQGKDLRLFVKELSAYFRDLMLCLISKDVVKDESVNIKSIEKNISVLDLDKKDSAIIFKIVEKFARLEYDMKWSSQPRLLLELAVIEAVDFADKPDKEGQFYTGENKKINRKKITEKTAETNEKLESQIKPEGIQPKDVFGPETGIEPFKNSTVKKGHRDIDKTVNESKTYSVEQITKNWENVLGRVKKIKMSAYGFFREAELVDVFLDGENAVLKIGFSPKHKFHKMMAGKPENKKVLEEALSKTFGSTWDIRTVDLGEKYMDEDNEIIKKAIDFFGKDKIEID